MIQSPVAIKVTCKQCGEEFALIVESEDLRRWKSGVLVQKAFPYLKPAERELLISGFCDSCFESMFGDEEED